MRVLSAFWDRNRRTSLPKTRVLNPTIERKADLDHAMIGRPHATITIVA